MKIFYHDDADGKCAAFWIQFGLRPNEKPEFFPINYGMKFPFETIALGERVFILDYSISPDEMERLLQITENVVWIDHHISAIKNYADFPHEIQGIRWDGIAACLLAFAYVFGMTVFGDGPVSPFSTEMCGNAPLFTKYIADRDVWKFEYGEKTREFTAGLSLVPHGPEEELWDELFFSWCEEENTLLDDISEMGRTVIKYRKTLMAKTCKACGFATTFAGLPTFAVNQSFMGSDDYIGDLEEYPLLMSFSFNGKKWVYSLRANAPGVDCAAIAAQYGGGGHKGAAGFVSDKLLVSADKGVM